MLTASLRTKHCNISHSLACLLGRCRSTSELKQIHALFVTNGLSTEEPFASELLYIRATSRFSNMEDAHQIFLQISKPTTHHYNTLIRGYSVSKNPNKSILSFVEMMRRALVPDHLTYPFLAKASSRMSMPRLGESIHGFILRYGQIIDIYISNSLVHMYGSFGDIPCARKVFDEMQVKNLVSWNSMLDGYAKSGDVALMQEVFNEMPYRDVVSWSSLIDGYVKEGEYAEALAIFDKMKRFGPRANEVTMVSVLSACSRLGALEKGQMMHRYVVEEGLPLTLALRTSFVDMYAKCGAINDAVEMFQGGSLRNYDVLIWNSLIGGLATHGFSSKSVEIYREMQRWGIKADEVTYLCLLSACAHAGMVKEARSFLESLTRVGLTPAIEHYACMIDVLARVGQLTEAVELISQMPMEPTASMLGALLSGSIHHRRLDLAELVGKKLVQVEPDHDGRYVGLSNVYALVKRWDEARMTREAMESRGVKKYPGFSYVEIFGTLHRFVARDEMHPMSELIYDMLHLVVGQMKLGFDMETEECCFYNV